MLHHERAARRELHRHLDPGRGQPVEHGREPAELPVDIGGVGARRVEVGADAAEPEARQLGDGGDHLHRLLGGHAQALEPRVHLHEDLDRLARGGGVGVGLVEVGDRGDEAVRDDVRRGRRQRIREDEDRQRHALPARPDRVGEIGEGQRVGAVRDEDLRHLAGAEPVAIGLEHGEDLALGADQPAHRAQVLRRGVEIDLEPRRPQKARRDAHGAGRAGAWSTKAGREGGA